MSKVQMLRVKRRLTAAVEETFGLFERTIAEYEEELCRSKEENERHRKLLDAVDDPQLRLHRAEAPPEQKEGSFRLDQVVKHIKEEQQDFWTSQEGEQLQNYDTTKFPSTSVPVKSEDDEEKPQSSSLLRALIKQQLTAAVEETFGLFERRIAEYEEELCRSKKENERQKLLDSVFNPQLQLHRADVQQLLVVKEEVPTEQQEWSSSLNQEDPEHPRIKEEQKELWTSKEGEQLQGLEEADIKIPFTPVSVKGEEDDEEKPQSSQHHQRETEQMESDGEDCGGPEPVRNADPDRHPQPDTDDKTGDSSEPETNDSDDWKETKEPQSGLNSLENDVPVNDRRSGEKPFSCSECGKRFSAKKHLNRHMRIHTGENMYTCSVCERSFLDRRDLTVHMRSHTGEKPFSCSVCNKGFTAKQTQKEHMRIHTGEKLFTCSVCTKGFTMKPALKKHMRIHTGEKPFTCSVCNKGFAQSTALKTHMRIHTGEKPFTCSVCNKGFTMKQTLKEHMRIHTGEKPFTCSVCNKGFTVKQALKKHMSIHTGEKPFTCSVCNKGFPVKQTLKDHIKIHTGERPFTCSVCNKGFTMKQTLKNHMRIHTGEKPFTCSVCDNGFVWKEQLKKHMLTHTGEKNNQKSVEKV